MFETGFMFYWLQQYVSGWDWSTAIAMIGIEPVERSNQGYATQGFLPFQSLLTFSRISLR